MNEQELRKKIAETIGQCFESACRYVNCNECEYHKYGENCTDYLYADALISAGIGDVSEWKHRAEVAERAVREFAVQVGCKSCPFYCRCGIDSPNAKNDYQECYEAILRQAEKELQEERKE